MAFLTQFTVDQLERLWGPETHAELARAFSMSDMPIRRWRRKNGWAAPASTTPPTPACPLGTPGITSRDGESTVTSQPIDAEAISAAGGAEAYLRERWGFPAGEWHCVSASGNEWLGQRSAKLGGGTVLLGQVKGSFRPTATLADILPRPAKWGGPRALPLRAVAESRAIWQMLVLADHQAPYHDENLHAATLALIEWVQPERVGHIGDLCDYTNISKHRDHAVVKATVDECTDAGVAILHDIRTAAPHAHIQVLEGNHDVRPLTELLARAERMAGIRSGNLPGSPGQQLIALDKLWRLEELGIEYVTDPRGWQHAELDIVPGPRGLCAVHGWLTGPNTAGRTLDKIGRSVIAAHTHQAEHVYRWSQQLQAEQQAVVVGCQCEVRGGGGKSFPTFAPRDSWVQGPALVTVHPDGEFTIERARWNGDSLYLGRERYTA